MSDGGKAARKKKRLLRQHKVVNIVPKQQEGTGLKLSLHVLSASLLVSSGCSTPPVQTQVTQVRKALNCQQVRMCLSVHTCATAAKTDDLM